MSKPARHGNICSGGCTPGVAWYVFLWYCGLGDCLVIVHILDGCMPTQVPAVTAEFVLSFMLQGIIPSACDECRSQFCSKAVCEKCKAQGVCSSRTEPATKVWSPCARAAGVAQPCCTPILCDHGCIRGLSHSTASSVLWVWIVYPAEVVGSSSCVPVT